MSSHGMTTEEIYARINGIDEEAVDLPRRIRAGEITPDEADARVIELAKERCRLKKQLPRVPGQRLVVALKAFCEAYLTYE